MQITKLTTTDGFLAIDLPDAGRSSGVVRCARKILQDGAVNLARSLTYTYAAYGIRASGASAGINAEGDARDGAVAAFVAELADQVATGTLSLDAGKGVTAADLAPWGHQTAGDSAAALATGVGAAAGAAVAAAGNELAGTKVAVDAGTPGADAIVAEFSRLGATAEALPLAELAAAGAAVVVVGSKPAALDHENVSAFGDVLIIGAAPLSITARGLATARRNGAVVVADFLAGAGPTLAAEGVEDIAAAVTAATTASLGHEEGPYLGACYAAEEFLRTWTAELPFGRPLA